MADPGEGIKRIVKGMLQSKQFSDKVFESQGVNPLDGQDAFNGTFVEDGAIGSNFLPNGMSPNVLSAGSAEYESWYALDTDDKENLMHPWADAWTERINDAAHLIFSLSANTDRTYTNPFYDRAEVPWFKVQDGQDYIFSTTVTRPEWDIDGIYFPKVGIRVRAADDNAGLNTITVYNTEIVDMWVLNNDNNNTQRIYTKFNIPAGKPYIKIDVTGESDQDTWPYVAINWNMLESVTDYRSFPSKYAAPTPRAGELSAGQMAFGLGKNILPYGFSTLSNLYVPDQHDATNWFVDVYSVIQGKSWISAVGNGFWFGINATNVYRLPYTTLIPNGATSLERLKSGDTYILSCDVQNNTEVAITASMRVMTNTSVANVNANTGWTQQGITTKTIPATPSEPIKMHVKFTVPSGQTYGPQIQLKGLRASGTSWGTYDELYMSNVMLEKLPAGSVQSLPSAYTAPIAGYRDISRNQLDVEYAGVLQNTTSRNISSGAEQTQPISWVWRQKFATADLQSNYLWMPEPGVWWVAVWIQYSTSTTDATRMRAFLWGDVDTVTLAQLALQTTGAGSYTTSLSGSGMVRLDAATGFELRVTNSSATARTIDNVQVYVARLTPWSSLGALA